MSAPATTPAAVRQRRYRAHRSGDHRLCLPGRSCRAELDAAARPVRDGARLFRELDGDRLPPATRARLVEACRCLDRMRHLSRELDRAIELDDAGRPGLDVTRISAEHRAQLDRFREHVRELERLGVGAPAAQPVLALFGPRRSPHAPVTTHRRRSPR